MSEQFNNKDYSDYFSAIEKRLTSEIRSVEKQDAKKPTPVQKDGCGKVIKLRGWVYLVAIFLVVTIIAVIAFSSKANTRNDDAQIIENTDNTASKVEKEEEKVNLYAEHTDDTDEIASDIISQNVIVINCDSNEVVAARNPSQRCYPASTTKIMTILTAVDYITDYNQTLTFSYEITDPFHLQGATMAGFMDGEAITITDMLYGAILPSGADATAGIAIKLAGGEEEFVKLMNKKAKQLGLKNTKFTNASGLYDKNHYTTPEDMAVIIREAMKNELCKKILSTYQHTTQSTPQHPEGIVLTSTLFSHMYGTEPEGSDILGGKTGYVDQSGYCIASFGKSDGGTEYVCVTLNGQSLWPTIYDQINLYTRYAK